MTVTALPLSFVQTPGMDEFRDRVRQALDAFDPDATNRWEQDGRLPREAVSTLARHGVFRARWEAGAEGGLPFLIALSQEASRRCSGLALAAMGHSEMFTGALTWLASSAAQLALLEDALDGRVVGCFAATEPQGGSDLAGIRATATAVAGGWRLRGCKRYVSNIGGASHVLVLARTATAAHAADLSLFIVPLSNPGVAIDGFFHAVGIPACDVGQVSFDTDLPAEGLLGQAGLGLPYVSHLLGYERISICAQLLTAAEVALRLAVAYARWRTTGGARILDRQVIRHRLAGCQAELWNLQARLDELTVRAQRLHAMPAREIAAFKLTVGESVGRIVDACMQVFGARGAISTFPLERIWRDTRLARLGGGADEVLADLVASGMDRPDPEAEQVLHGYLSGDSPDTGLE